MIAASARSASRPRPAPSSTPMSPDTDSMPAIGSTARKHAIREIASRQIRTVPSLSEHGAPMPTSRYFGMNTFGARQMRDKLPKDVFAKLAACVRHGKKLGDDVAPVVAQVIKDWAVSRGVTHLCHWFH